MDEERKIVLKMLDEGKIDVEEANELLSSLEKESGGKDKEGDTPGNANFLKILVVEDGEEEVNITFPIGLAKFLKKITPEKARSKLSEKGVDLSKVIEEIEGGTFDGKLVDIEDGNSRVEIRLGK
ncbi:MAG: SHOCT-like domain-containing protein [Candidatus Acetothermia bacterium]